MNIRKEFTGKEYPIPGFILDSYRAHLLQDYYEREYYPIVLLQHDDAGKKCFAKLEGRIDGSDYACWTEITKPVFDDIRRFWDISSIVFIQHKHDLEKQEGEDIYMVENEEIVLSAVDISELTLEVPRFPAVLHRLTVPYIYSDLTEPVKILSK